MHSRRSTFRKVQKALVTVLFAFSVTQAQVVYFHQDFTKTTGLVNPLPDTGQFSHVILTAPALSYHKFHKGYMELVRSRQDSATGGIIRALRATAFEPTPKTLFVQLTLSAEQVQSPAVNALYLYIGEDFNPVNNSFPGNQLMFAKCAINFGQDSIIIKDPETQALSRPVPVKKIVKLTWVLNNSGEDLAYHLSPALSEKMLRPGAYDLWVDDEAVATGSPAYPGNATYSAAKLSNFEIRFRNGLGKVRIYDILIREANEPDPHLKAVAMPNPVTGRSFALQTFNMDIETLEMLSPAGKKVIFEVMPVSRTLSRINLPAHLSAGFYILRYKDLQRRRQSLKVVVN